MRLSRSNALTLCQIFLLFAPAAHAIRTPIVRESSFWHLYRPYILAAIAVCAIQAGLIVALLIQAARRRRAELDAQVRQRELTHISRLATVGELTVTLAHELQQPLQAILMNARAAQHQVLRLSSDSPNRTELLQTLDDIIHANESAVGVLRSVRGLLRKGDVQRQPVDLSDVVRDALRLFNPDLAARRIVMTTMLTPDLPAVDGDRVELEQVLLNLVLNASDAVGTLPPDQRMIKIQALMGEDNGIQVSVSDRGGGIPADQLDRIFQPFFTSKENGLGLGLAICRRIITAHRGRIWAESRDGATTVSFWLPADKARASGSPDALPMSVKTRSL